MSTNESADSVAPRSRLRLIIGLATISVLAVIATVVANAGTVAPIRQPLLFNHAAHAETNTTCDVCHQTVETGQSAGRPSAEICAECHDLEDEPVNESSAVTKLREYLSSGERIPWRRLFTLAPDVRFHHGRHVGRAKIPCTECHGDIGSSSSPPERPFKIFSMDDCIECHVKTKASEDCLACHR